VDRLLESQPGAVGAPNPHFESHGESVLAALFSAH